MLYRISKGNRWLGHTVLRLFAVLDGRKRRRRRTEMDLLSLSPYLQRDIGFPGDD